MVTSQTSSTSVHEKLPVLNNHNPQPSSVKLRFFKKPIVIIIAGLSGLFFALVLLKMSLVLLEGNKFKFNPNFFDNIENLPRNYASAVSVEKKGEQQTPFAESQKYEKIGVLSATTTSFETDEITIKDIAKQYNAIVQFEKDSGTKANRELHVSIAVRPMVFNTVYATLQTVGSLKAKEVKKTDKTDEYRKSNAKKASLTETLAYLRDLKNTNSQISNQILHDKISEIEAQIKELEITLQYFNEENQFCTVQFSLYEMPIENRTAFFNVLTDAFQWGLKYYAVVLCFVLLVFLLRNLEKINLSELLSTKSKG